MAKAATARRPAFAPIPSHDRKGRALRDAVTGEPFQRDTLRLRYSDTRLDNLPSRAAYADGFRADETPTPVRLHTPQVEEGGLGGHLYSRQFALYLSSGLREKRRDARQADDEWWRSSYGRLRVKAWFIREDGAAAGMLAWRIALARESDYLTTDEVMTETGLDAKQIARCVSRALIFAWQPALRVVRPLARRDVAG